MHKVMLKKGLGEHIREKLMNGTINQSEPLILLYLRYMCILSRQLVRSLTVLRKMKFNPLTISTQIEQGIWAEAESLNNYLSFMDEDEECNHEYSKHLYIDKPEKVFAIHAANMREILNDAVETFNKRLS